MLAKLKSMAAVVGNDAEVSGSAAPLKRKGGEDTVIPDAGPPPPLAIGDRPLKKVKVKGGDSHAKQSGGVYTHNKKGAELCLGYQTGSCRDSKGCFCCRSPERVHQCNICLAQHAGSNCTKLWQHRSSPRRGKAKARVSETITLEWKNRTPFIRP